MLTQTRERLSSWLLLRHHRFHRHRRNLPLRLLLHLYLLRRRLRTSARTDSTTTKTDART